MYRFLLSDADFRELNIPIPPQDYRALEIQVSKYQPLKPVPTWNGYILTGYEQDHLCQKYHRSYPTTEMKFQRKADAMAWICRKQLEREDINRAARAWLLYRLYEALREIDKRREAKEDFQYRKLSPTAQTSPKPRREMENIAMMQQVAEEYDYNKATIRRYAVYGRNLDELEKTLPGIRYQVLTGKKEILIKDMPAILKMPEEALKEAAEDRNVLRIIPPEKYYEKENRREKNRPDIELCLKTGIKEMPAYNPDAEANSLVYTFGTWKKAMARARENDGLRNATKTKKESLEQALRMLILEAQGLDRMLEEKRDD